MRLNKWLGFAIGVLLIVSCFIAWVTITSKNILVTGVAAEGTSFGKPGYFHLLFASFFILFNFIPRIWAKRANLIVTALNLAWAIRNYFIITACRDGECPVKHTGIYLVLIASVLLIVAALFPDMKMEEEAPKNA